MDPVEAERSEPYQREVVLAQQECLRRTGLLAYSGILSLSTHRLRFEPRGTLDRLVGASEVQVRIDEIVDLTYAKLEMVLGIQTRNGTHRFSGHGARRIHRRLDAFLNERDGKDSIKRDFQDGERVIVCEFGQLNRPGEMNTKGNTFSLTDAYASNPQVVVSEALKPTTPSMSISAKSRISSLILGTRF